MFVAAFLYVFPLLAQEVPAPETGFQCRVPQEPVRIPCQKGGEFLCVESPPGGVAEANLTLTGRVNQTLGALSHFEIRIQNDYTKKIRQILPTNPLNGEGIFSILIPLEEVGPYTIAVAASRINGEVSQKTVRTSFVTSLSLTSDLVSVEEGSTHYQVVIDLLKDCAGFCDFIGAGTGGVKISVLNQITTASGTVRSVECKTTVTQGGTGRFTLGIPKLPGENQLKIRACNASNAKNDACPELDPMTLAGAQGQGKIILLNPSEGDSPFFDRKKFPKMKIQFRLEGVSPAVPCGEQTKIVLNSGVPQISESQALCPDAAGNYETLLDPEEGYNFAHIFYQEGETRIQKIYSFAWGSIQSPEELIKNGFEGMLSKEFLNRTLLPMVNRFLKSDGVGEWIREFTENVGRGKKEKAESDPLTEEILGNLDYCKSGGTLQAYRLKFVREPTFEEAKIGDLEFKNGSLTLPVDLKKFETSVQFYPDENGDGVPDEDPIPLKISFRRAKPRLIIAKREIRGESYWVLDSPYTDCDYKKDAYCSGLPALFVPKNFVGDATPSGGFVRCDESQGVSKKMKDKCHSVNSFNMQTGLLNEKILDALNQMVACQGAGALGALAKRGVSAEKIQVAWQDSVLSEKGLQLKTDWFFPEAKTPIVRKPAAPAAYAPKSGGGVQVALRMDLLNRMASMIPSHFQYGPDTLRDMKFDFISECDAKKAEGGEGLNPLCNFLPRVQELMGTPLSENRYLDLKHPLLLDIAPSPVLPAEIHLVDLPDQKQGITLRMADATISIYSVQVDVSQGVDAYGNPTPLRGSDGNIIRDEVPLIQVKLGLYLTLSLEGPFVSAEDPSSWFFEVHPVAEKSRWFVDPLEDTNSTVIPATNLVANLREKLNFAITMLAQQGEECTICKIPLPKAWNLSNPMFGEDSWMARLGIKEVRFSAEGLKLQWNSVQDRIEGSLHPVIQQVLPITGEWETFMVP